ncbi:MAG TPA: universal stress protein [Terriglobales bacterium]|nr:universal stress protein [Terriglobales bacterium]
MDTAVASGISLQNILLATDFSSWSDAALSYAIGLCRRYHSTLYTAHVVREEISEVQPPDPFYLLHSAEARMKRLVVADPFRGIAHRELLREGDVARELAELVEGLRIDLLVLGTRGRGGIKKMLLGSVAEQIVGSAPCPVLTVGPQVSTLGAAGNLKSILYATDLLHHSARSLDFALHLARGEEALLTLAHVVKPLTDAPSDYVEAARADAATRIRQLVPAEMHADCVVEVGMPSELILRVAAARKAELIVIGTHHGSSARVSAHLPWTTPHQVISHAACPVVSVRDSAV